MCARRGLILPYHERVSWDGAVAKLKAADEAMCDLFLVLDCA